MSSEWNYRGYWIPFPRPVPAISETQWNAGDQRNICIPSTYLPFVLGALKVLCRRETYSGSHTDIEFCVEQANNLLRDWQDGCPMPIQFRQTLPCLLEYSTDGGIVWTGAYNGQLCINSNIADGTLSAGTTANPSKPVATGGCQTYSIQVQEQTDFVLPTTVSAGDVITVSGVSGEWADGWLGNLWYCYDGSSYVLGVCIGGSNPAKSGDPLQTAQHQQLICKIGATYYDCLAGPITVPVGVSNALLSFLPNNGTARSGGTGVVKAQVEICNNSTWCYEFDFTAGNGGWTYDIDPTYAAYTAGAGWGKGSQGAVIHIRKSCTSTTISRATVWVSGYDTAAYDAAFNFFSVWSNDSSGNMIGNDPYQFNTGATRPFVGVTQRSGVTAINIHGGFHYAASPHYTKVRLEGSGSNPFGSNNCA